MLNILSILILDEYMLLGLKEAATDWMVCRDACESILPGATSFQDPMFVTCRCYFCPRGLMNSLLRSDKMRLFLIYTGCKDIYSFTTNPKYPGRVYYCKSEIGS